MNNNHPYSTLTPERVMDAIDALGFVCDARIFALNSYENRVYQVGIEDGVPLIAKFYRPGRWSPQAIREEHAFLQELAEDEIPVVAPLEINGETLFFADPFWFALFPRRGGHAPELSNLDDLELIGRWLGRLHLVGNCSAFQHRQTLQGIPDIDRAAAAVLDSGLMPKDYREVYISLHRDLLASIRERFDLSQYRTLRLHGDLHCGNLLLRDEQLYLVDFDDCLQGMAMQDIWMLLSGQRDEQLAQLDAIRSGYEMFRPFPYQELSAIEVLRTVRVMKHAAWLAQRWEDPAFPAAFPWFESHHFWSEHILTLREQLTALCHEPLFLHG
jgi:Ser/Thr protein kinase RdoA (MazF antagonist)